MAEEPLNLKQQDYLMTLRSNFLTGLSWLQDLHEHRGGFLFLYLYRMFIEPPGLFRASNIVSLVPSQTELLYYLKGDVTGITKFCIHPDEWFRTKVRVGGTKQLHSDKIRSLAPGLIIANHEENVKAQVEEIAKEFPVWVTNVNDLDDALTMISNMGVVTGNQTKADELSKEIKNSFDDLKPLRKIPAAYLIWKDPLMAAGSSTFIDDMLNRAGYFNVFSAKSRYPEISPEELSSSGAEIIFLSSEPYPFSEKHIHEMSAALPGKKLMLVDGEMFSWYGNRLLRSASYFRKLYLQAETHVL